MTLGDGIHQSFPKCISLHIAVDFFILESLDDIRMSAYPAGIVLRQIPDHYFFDGSRTF